RDEGYFKDEGLDLEFVTTPGMAQVTTSHFVKIDSIFDRPLDSAYNEGGIDQYRMCEWGIMKRAVEACAQGLRGRKIVALGASMSKFAIVVSRDSKVYEPEMLKDKPIAVTPNKRFRAHATGVKLREKDRAPFVYSLVQETGGLREPHELQTWRLLHAAPQRYTRERFEDTYSWTVKWNMAVPGATYENTVDNRAWD